MKHAIKVTLLIISIIIFKPTYGQVERGDANIGANIFISTITGIDQDNVTGILFLSYQQFITKSISLGFGPLYQWSTFDTNVNSTFGANFFANYSFLNAGGKWLPYAGLKYFGSITYSETDSGTSYSYTEIRNGSFGVNGGVKFFFSERANIDTNLSYTTVLATSVDTGSGFESQDAEGGILQFTIGIGVIIGKRGS